MTANSPWFDKLSQYLRDGFSWHESDRDVGIQIRKLIRWWLEQVRNLLVVSAFSFLAQKSDSRLLKFLAEATFWIYFAYFTGWTNSFSFRFLPYIKNARLNFWLNMALWMLVIMPIYFLIVFGVMRAFTDLSKIPPK
jgi:hypothetical protein